MSWISSRPLNESLKIVRETARLCSELGGPLSKSLFKLLDEGHFNDLVNFKFDYQVDSNVDDLIYSRQIHALVAKQDYIDLGIDKEKVAFTKFLECEEKCRLTNDRFSDGSSLSKDVRIVFHYAIRKIASILGDCPKISSFDFSFGPGATTSTKKAHAHPLRKFMSRLECSENFLPLVEDVMDSLPSWREYHTHENRYRISISPSKLVFVPKDSRTFRPIGIEPVLNGFCQKGVGKYLKHRLKIAGIDLSDQERNRSLAKRGSIDGSLSTIDLSSASDTISYNLVLHMLPFEWFCLLDNLRSSRIVYKDKSFDLERFSSMGNAYTFELESLIFYSLCYGVARFLGTDIEDISVYGDDLIVPVSMYETLKSVLEECGFEVNSSKSFRSGPFRESCGADYFNGTDIRPFYQKTLISDRNLFVMHNWFVRNGEQKLSKLILSFILPHHRIFGPDGYGDGHLIGSYRLRSSRKLKRCGYEGGFFDTFTLNPRRSIYLLKKIESVWVYPLYCTYVSDPETEQDHSVLPGSKGYSRISIYTLSRSVFNRRKAQPGLSRKDLK